MNCILHMARPGICWQQMWQMELLWIAYYIFIQFHQKVSWKNPNETEKILSMMLSLHHIWSALLFIRMVFLLRSPMLVCLPHCRFGQHDWSAMGCLWYPLVVPKSSRTIPALHEWPWMHVHINIYTNIFWFKFNLSKRYQNNAWNLRSKGWSLYRGSACLDLRTAS